MRDPVTGKKREYNPLNRKTIDPYEVDLWMEDESWE